MTPERWQRIEELFEGALKLEPAERAPFLMGACANDEELRGQVMRLLVQHDSADNFREIPPLGRVTSAPTRSVFSSEQVVGGRFRIVKTIGQGGMGEVYEAFDVELRDSVALKTIRHDIASDPRFIERFKREVQRSRSISHPNVCRVYDLFRERGMDDADVWFLTMELLRGETLSNRINREQHLDTATAIAIVKQMCDALDAAHESGVVHRDFKSGNVMLVAGPRDSTIRVVVTDFGLARPTGTSPTTNTASFDDLGQALGTPAYMAPEQVEGKPATAASDLYALGIVMYEMVTGTRPFVADSALSVAVQRLTEPPITPRAHVPDLDSRWEQTILRCLERDPAWRFRSAGEVFRALTGSTPAARIIESAEDHRQEDIAADGRSEMPLRSGRRLRHRAKLLQRVLPLAGAVVFGLVLLAGVLNYRGFAPSSIAVVPFSDDGHDPEMEYLSDGLTEGVIDSLVALPQPTLSVIAFNSVMRYKRREIDAKVIGRELRVGAVLIGKIVQRSDGLSISAELVNATNQNHMWGQTYAAGLSELPTVQQDIAEKISDTLRPRLDGVQKTRPTKRHTDNVDAYRLYLKGRYFWNRYTEEGWKKAIEFFNQAIAIDPNYALAWAGLADTYYQLSSLVLRPEEAIPRARAAAIRALAIDESVAEAHASLGIIKAQYDWDPKGAEKELKRAIELNANYATAHEWYGMYLFADAQFEAARAELNKAQELDPFSLIITVTAVWPLLHLGQDELAVKQLENAIEMFPNVPDLVDYLHEVRGEMYLQRRRYDDAVADLLNGFRTKALCGNDTESIEALKRAYATSGFNGYYHKQLELASPRYQQEFDAARKQSPQRYVSPYRLAELSARLGDKERAFALLQECYKNRDESLRWLKAESLSVDSPWQSIRSDPRFTQLLRGVGLAE